jgi:hypothetical protein
MVSRSFVILVISVLAIAALTFAAMHNPSAEEHRAEVRAAIPDSVAAGVAAYHSLRFVSYTEIGGRVVSIGLFGIVFVSSVASVQVALAIGSLLIATGIFRVAMKGVHLAKLRTLAKGRGMHLVSRLGATVIVLTSNLILIAGVGNLAIAAYVLVVTGLKDGWGYLLAGVLASFVGYWMAQFAWRVYQTSAAQPSESELKSIAEKRRNPAFTCASVLLSLVTCWASFGAIWDIKYPKGFEGVPIIGPVIVFGIVACCLASAIASYIAAARGEAWAPLQLIAFLASMSALGYLLRSLAT